LTVISMMFDTPTTPASNVAPPTIHDIAHSTKNTVSNLPNSTNALNEPIATLSSGATWWARINPSRT